MQHDACVFTLHNEYGVEKSHVRQSANTLSVQLQTGKVIGVIEQQNSGAYHSPQLVGFVGQPLIQQRAYLTRDFTFPLEIGWPRFVKLVGK
jgi:hypothetical protein